MKHVALFHDTVVSCWPLKAAEEYKKKFGPGAFREESYGREAVFLGEWLYSHMNEFKIVDTVDEVDKDSDDIYQVREGGFFAWSAEYDICETSIAEILDNDKWHIGHIDHGCRQMLVVHKNPDEYGYVQTARVSM